MSQIWFINQYAISPDLPGGTRHYDFGVELVKYGHSTRVFASDVNLALRTHTRNLEGRLWMEEKIQGVLFEWINTNTYKSNDWRRALNMFVFSWNVYRAGLKQNVRPDFIIGSSPHLFAALAGYYLSRHYGCRFILEVRDLWPQTLVDAKSISEKHPLVWVMRKIEKKLYSYADHIIVLAEGSIKYIQGRGVKKEKIIFIPNGVHPEHFIPHLSREECRRRYHFDKFTIIYTGAHGPLNSLYTILEAANYLRDEKGIKFVLVGDGPEKPKLKEKAINLGLTNVNFFDPVSKKEIPNLLLAADAAIITLKDNSVFHYGVSPNKLFDYMAAGKPVLCAVPGSMAEMVRDCGCGLTSQAENGEALADRIRQIASLNRSELIKMGQNGRKRVMEHYTRPMLVKRFVELALLQDNSDFHNTYSSKMGAYI